MVPRSAHLIFSASLMIFVTQIEGPWMIGKDPCAEDTDREKESSSSGLFSRIFNGSFDQKLEERAYYLFNRGRFEEALICFEKAIKIYPLEAKFHRDRGICHLRLKRYDSAVVDFTKLLELEPDSAKGRILLAETFFESGKLCDALENLQMALKQTQIEDSERVEVDLLRPKVYSQLKEILTKGWPQEGNEPFLASDPCALEPLKREGPTSLSTLSSLSNIPPPLEAVEEKPEVTPDVINDQGNGHFAAGEYRTAHRCYTNAIIQMPHEAKYYRNRGNCSRKLYRNDEALDDVKKSLDLDRQNARGRFLLAQTFFDSDKYQEAAQTLNQILKDSSISNDEEILVKNLLKKALQYSRDSCAEDEDEDVEPWFLEIRRSDFQKKIDERANLLFTMEKFKEALICYDKAIKNRPREPEYYRKRGFCHSKLGRLDLAITDYERLLKLLSNRAVTKDRLILINALYDAERYCEAYEQIEYALEESFLSSFDEEELVSLQKNTMSELEAKMEEKWPQEGDRIVTNRSTETKISDPCADNDVAGLPELTPDELNERGNVWFAAEEYNEALLCYSKAIEGNSNETKYYRNRAWCLKQMGDLETAYADLKVLSDFEALDVRTRFLLAVILFRYEKDDEASEHLKLVLTRKDVSIEEEFYFKFLLKKIIRRKQEKCIDGAEAELRQWFPNSSSLVVGSPVQRANQYFNKGRYEEALLCYTLAIKSDIDNPNFYKKRGVCHSKLGHLDSALEDYEMLVQLKRHNASIKDQLLLAQALYDMKRYCKAYENLERVLEDSRMSQIASEDKEELLRLQEKTVRELEEEMENSWLHQETTNKETDGTEMMVMDVENEATALSEDLLQQQNSQIPTHFPQEVEVSYELNERGNIFFASQNYSAALQSYSKAIEGSPKEAKYYRNRARCYIQLNDLEGAYTDLKISSDFEALDMRARYLLARIMVELNEYKDASENLKLILKENKLPKEEEIPIKFYLKKILQHRLKTCDEGADEEMKEWFPNSISHVSVSPAEKAHEFLAEKKYKAAISCYNKAIEVDPDDRNFYKNRGICHLNLGEFDLAIADFEKMVDVEPLMKVAISDRLLLAQALYGSGRFYDAYKTVRKCLEESRYVWPRTNEAELISLQQKALSKIEERLVNSWSQEGKVVEISGDTMVVENSLCTEETSSQTPDDILNAQGNGFFARNKYTEACRCYSKAIEKNRTKASYYRNRGFCFGKLNLARSAIADLETAIKLEPRNARGLFLLTQILSHSERGHLVAEYMREARKDLHLTGEEEVLWNILYDKAVQKEELWCQKERIRKGKQMMISEDKKKNRNKPDGRGQDSIKIND